MSEVLTEHLGYQPISVIDDIIDVANGLVYKFSEQLDNALKERRRRIIQDGESKQTKGPDEDDDVMVNEEKKEPEYTEQDIAEGTAKLETLLEHLVNRNYDKLEVYALRNILTIPEELVDGGFVTLKHQEGLRSADNLEEEGARLDREYKQQLEEAATQLRLNRALNEALVRSKRLLKLSTTVRSKVLSMDYNGQIKGSDGSKPVEKRDLKPLQDVCRYLASEVRSLYQQVLDTADRLSEPSIDRATQETPDDRYLRETVARLAKEAKETQ